MKINKLIEKLIIGLLVISFNACSGDMFENVLMNDGNVLVIRDIFLKLLLLISTVVSMMLWIPHVIVFSRKCYAEKRYLRLIIFLFLATLLMAILLFNFYKYILK